MISKAWSFDKYGKLWKRYQVKISPAQALTTEQSSYVFAITN
jgi:hypothetical protein